jgi:hypothetical protein
VPSRFNGFHPEQQFIHVHSDWTERGAGERNALLLDCLGNGKWLESSAISVHERHDECQNPSRIEDLVMNTGPMSHALMTNCRTLATLWQHIDAQHFSMFMCCLSTFTLTLTLTLSSSARATRFDFHTRRWR